MTARRADWPERLAAFLEARQGESFAWGESDCALFAADWVLEARGLEAEDPAGRFRHRYRDRDQAVAVLQAASPFTFRLAEEEELELGGFGLLLACAVTEALGDPLATPRLAQRGDVVALRDERDSREIVLGVCSGVWVAVLDVEHGLQRRPAADAILAWRV